MLQVNPDAPYWIQWLDKHQGIFFCIAIVACIIAWIMYIGLWEMQRSLRKKYFVNLGKANDKQCPCKDSQHDSHSKQLLC